MEEKTKILYDNLYNEGLYTKTYDEFVSQFSDDEKRSKLHSSLQSEGLYTKSYDEFNNQFFSTLKKKDDSEVVSETPSQEPSVPSETALSTESPSPSQEPEPEPKPDTAKTFGEWVTGAAGVLNKSLAKAFDELDWVQTTAGDAVNQVLLGKEAANTARELRDKGVIVSPMATVRPFKAVADALEWTAGGTKELPQTIGGQVVSGIASITPDILATIMMPEVKTGKLLADLGIKTTSKFGTVMAGRGAIESAEQVQTGPVSQQITAPLLAATEGYLTGMVFDNMGQFSHNIGNKLADKLIPKVSTAGGYINRALVSQPTSVLANALMFGGYGTGQELLETGSTSSNTFFVNAGMGVGMGISGVAKVMYAKGVNSFMATPNADVARMSKVEITPQELIDNGIKKAESIEKGASANPEADLAAAAMNINTGINKAFAEEVKANPEGVKKDIADSNLDNKVKESINDKIDDLVAMEDPMVQQARPYSDEVKFIDSKIESLKKNKTLSSVEKDLQIQDLNTRKEELTAKITEIYKPQVKDETKQEQVPKGEEGKEEKTVEKEEVGKESETAEIKPLKEEVAQEPTQGEIVKPQASNEVKKPIIESQEGLQKINYTIRESDNKFTVELRDEVTDKAIPTKLKEFEAEANQKLEAERKVIIEDIQKADKASKKGADTVDVNTNRYKVTQGKNGLIVRSITQGNELVTNKALKEKVVKAWEKSNKELSDIQMKLYDERVAEYKKTLQDEIDAKVRDYENQRRSVVLKESDKPVFTDGKVTAAKEGDTEQGIKERKELPSERDAAETKMINTWEQFKRELKIEAKAAKRGAKEAERVVKERVNKLIDMISVPENMMEIIEKDAVDAGFEKGSKDYKAFVAAEKKNRDPFKNIPNKVYVNMMKRATESGVSDVAYQRAVEYIDKALNDADFVRSENEKFELIDKAIEKLTAPKKILEKGTRGGSPKVKDKLLEKGASDINNTVALLEINELIQNGKSKRHPNPKESIIENETKIYDLESKLDRLLDPNNYTEANDKDIAAIRDMIDALQEVNKVLDFYSIREMEIPRIKEKLIDAQRIYNDQKTVAKEAKDKRKEVYSKLSEDVRKDINAKTYDVGEGGATRALKTPPKRTLSTRFLENTNFWSLIDIIMRGSNFKTGKMPILDNRINGHYVDMVTNAENTKAQRTIDLHEGFVNGMKDIYKVKKRFGGLQRKIIDLQSDYRIKVNLKAKEGGKEITHEAEMTPAQAMQKAFQWRSEDGRRSMMKITDKGYMMGYDQKAVDAMLSQLSPQELKVMELLEKVMDKHSEIYDQAYIKENGISMKTVNDFYWQLAKLAEPKVKEEIGTLHINPSIRKNRTIKRTKDSSPLAYGSAIEDVLSFANEAIHYEAWAQPLRELQYLFKDTLFRRDVSTRFGRAMVNQIDRNLKSFAGNLESEQVEVLDKLSNNYAAAILGFKVVPVINQLAASIYYAPVMPLKDYIKAISGATLTRASDTSTALRKLLKNDVFVKERIQNNSTALGMEIETVGAIVSTAGANPTWEAIKASSGLPELKQAAGSPLRVGDLTPIVAVGAGYVEYRYTHHSGKKLTADIIKKAQKGDVDPNLEKAIKDWRFMSMISQQSIRASNRSAISQRGTFGRIAGLFQSGPMGGHRVVSAKLRDFNRAYQSGDKKAMAEAAYGVFVGHAVTGALYGLIDAAFTAEDKKDAVKSVAVGAVLGNLQGLFLAGKAIKGLTDYMLDKPWAKKINSQLIPAMRNADNVQTYAYELANQLSASVKDEQAIADAIGKLAVSTSILLGLPVDGTMRIARATAGITEAIGRGIQEDRPASDVALDIKTTLSEGRFPDPIFRPEEDQSLSTFKSFQDAKDHAKLYFTFQAGPVVKTIDVFRKNDKYGRFEIDVHGLMDLITKSAWSPNINPKDVLMYGLNDRMRDRVEVLYGKGKSLNTKEEVMRVLKTMQVTDADRDMLEELLSVWEDYNPQDARMDAIDTIQDLIDKSSEITEKAIIKKGERK